MPMNRSVAIFALIAVIASAHAQSSSADQSPDLHASIVQAANDYKAGRVDQARTEFETLNRQNPSDPEIAKWLGFIDLVQNRGAEAVPLLKMASDKLPNDLEVTNNLGNAYYAAGDYDKALVCYQAVIHANSTMFIPYYNTGNIYLRKKDYHAAIENYSKAASLNAQDAAVQNDLGVAYEDVHDERASAVAFKKASDLKPDDKVFARNAGLALYKSGRATDAEAYLEKSDTSDPAVGLALGQIYSRKGERAQALKSYEAIRPAMGNDAAYWFNLGVMRKDSGDMAGAEQAYRKALQISPNDLDTNTNLGLLLFKEGKYSDSETYFQRVAGSDPNSVNAKLDLGSAAAKAGDKATAMASFKEVLRAEPNNTSVRLNLAELLYDAGDDQGAQYHYNLVLKQEPNNSRALNGIGLLHLKGSQLPQAEAAFRSSIEYDEHYLPAYNNLAVTLERMNRRKQAIAVLQRALTLDPNDGNVKRNLNRLRSEG